MNVLHEIALSQEKFNSVRALRELLIELDKVQYCAWGSFLSSVLFQSPFKGTFDLLVRDESDALEVLQEHYEVDFLHGSVLLNETNGGESGASLKVRLIDATSKNEEFRQFLIANSETRTCVVESPTGEVDKIEIPIPRRGPVLLLSLIEVEDSPQASASIIEKIIWSLTNVGVAPLLREARFVGKDYTDKAASMVEDLFVVHANKTVTLLHSNGSPAVRSITASELKTLGRPYAALLRA